MSAPLWANARLTCSWSSASALAQNTPASRILGHDDDVLAMLKVTSGGSSERDANEPMAVPTGPGDATTTTPVGKWPITWRYSA